MDTLKLLLGATMALLIGATLVFVASMKEGVRNAPPEEIALMQKQIQEMEEESRRLSSVIEQKKLRDSLDQNPEPVNATETAYDPVTVNNHLAIIEQEELLKAIEENNESITDQVAIINNAAPVANVAEWVGDPNIGYFAVIEISDPDSVTSGTKLALRRNGGILCKFKVSEVLPDGAIANPTGQVGLVHPEPGDELILADVISD